jgi:hypothetical protein
MYNKVFNLVVAKQQQLKEKLIQLEVSVENII